MCMCVRVCHPHQYPPEIPLSAFSRSLLPSWSQKKSALVVLDVSLLCPKFIWNFDVGVNVPGDAGQGTCMSPASAHGSVRV